MGGVGGQLHLLLVSRFSLRFLKFSLSKEKISLRSIFQYYPCRSSSYGSAELSLAISQMSQYCYRYRSEKLPDNGPALGDTDTETRWAFEHRQRQSNAPSGSHNVSNFFIWMLEYCVLCKILHMHTINSERWRKNEHTLKRKINYCLNRNRNECPLITTNNICLAPTRELGVAVQIRKKPNVFGSD